VQDGSLRGNISWAHNKLRRNSLLKRETGRSNEYSSTNNPRKFKILFGGDGEVESGSPISVAVSSASPVSSMIGEKKSCQSLQSPKVDLCCIRLLLVMRGVSIFSFVSFKDFYSGQKVKGLVLRLLLDELRVTLL
jgi:hypothetical protein